VAARLTWGRGGIGALFDRLFTGWKRPRWYVLAIGSQVVLAAVALGLAVVAGGGSVASGFEWAAIPALFIGLVLLNVWEEIGFRGFALRQHQRLSSALTAALVVGLPWALWHLPLFYVEDNPLAEIPFVLFLVETVGVSVVYTWPYNTTAGSVLFVTLFHVTGNLAGVFVLESEISLGTYIGFRAVAVWLAAVALIGVYGWRSLAPSSPEY
jgi:membrane protease YdiL (CAAX protease family)